jgi:glyoxylase-like metal-dependent hydrolase (beta-lactamase superfamily II)
VPEEVAENIYRIGIPLPNNPLKELNSYFIRGDHADLLIDTGFRQPVCRIALNESLEKLGSKPDRRDVWVTHFHSDHSGLAREFVGAGRRIFMSGEDMQFLADTLTEKGKKKAQQRYLAEAFPEDLLDLVCATNPAITMAPEKVDERFYGLSNGEALDVGNYSLQMILVPGHTPGNSMIWLKKQRIMFTGDHILFDITPNINAYNDMEDSLGDFLESLQKSREYPVLQAFPAHRMSGDYHDRINVLLAHHERRIAEVQGVVRSKPGLPAYEIAAYMTWKIRTDSWETFPGIQKWFAVGECMSHLDYLRKRGLIYRETKDGIWQYFAA